MPIDFTTQLNDCHQQKDLAQPYLDKAVSAAAAKAAAQAEYDPLYAAYLTAKSLMEDAKAKLDEATAVSDKSTKAGDFAGQAVSKATHAHALYEIAGALQAEMIADGDDPTPVLDKLVPVADADLQTAKDDLALAAAV